MEEVKSTFSTGDDESSGGIKGDQQSSAGSGIKSNSNQKKEKTNPFKALEEYIGLEAFVIYF